jgi:hypothetical protein
VTKQQRNRRRQREERRRVVRSDRTAGIERDGRWARLGEWRSMFLLLLLLRLGLGLVGLLAISLGTRASFGRGDWDNLVLRGTDLWSLSLSIWQRWDALWYEHIAREGYAVGDSSTAFFPLYPALARALAFLFGGNVILTELLLSSAGFVAAGWLLKRLTEMDLASVEPRLGSPGESTGRRLPVPTIAVLALVLFPTGFFLVAPYTESIFLALTLAAFWLARTGRPWMAGTAGLLVSLTRFQGTLLVLPLAYEYARRRGVILWLRNRGGRPPDAGVLSALLPILGTISFTVFQRSVVGEQRAGPDLLAFWGYRVVPPWEALASSWSYITSDSIPPGFGNIEALNLVCLFAFTALAIWAAVRLDIAYGLYALTSLALLFPRQMFFSPLMSSARYVLVVFPCFIVFAFWLSRRPLLAWGWLILSATLQLVLFQYWVRWGFVG